MGVSVLAAGLLPAFGNGLFSVTDVILLALLPVTWSEARRVPALRTLVLLCGLWLVSQVVSNIVNEVPAEHLRDGIWQPILVASSAAGIHWFAKGRPRQTATLLAAGLSVLIVHGAIIVASGGSSDPWKYQFGVPVTLLSVLGIGALWPTRGRLVSAALVAAFSSVNILLGFRSLGAICMIAAALLLLVPMLNRASTWRIGLAVLAGAIVTIATISAYSALARSGHLGYAQQAKYFAQTSTEANVLLAARPEALISLEAIQHHPFLGVGSAAQLDYSATAQALEALAAEGVVLSEQHYERLLGDGLNSHSLALGAWVQAGAVAVLPWLYLLYLGIRSCFQAASPRWMLLRPLTVVWTLSCGWDFLFSPWSPQYQILLGLFATLTASQLADHGVERQRLEPALADAASGRPPTP